ncbi:MAG: hypothetical protein LUC49_04975 [Prevotella sp.]|nr:hypothetical protein [Prevotella sp.]
MKKYIKPETEIIYIESLPVLAISEANSGGGGPGAAGGAMTKGNSEWLDEEDDLGW